MLKDSVEISLSFKKLKRLYTKELFPNEQGYLSKAIESYEACSLGQLVHYLDETPTEKYTLNWELRRIKRLEKLTSQERKLHYSNYHEIIEKLGNGQLKVFENVLDHLGLKLTLSDEILEVGCGRGSFMSQFMKKYRNSITGVDMDTSSLLINNKINELLGNSCYELFAQFGDNHPFEDKSFDFVVSFSTLEHVGDTKAKLNFIAELKRVCKREGMIVMSFPNRLNVFTPEEHVGLWFLGFIPRFLVDRYSRLFSAMPYKDIEPPTLIQIKRLLSHLNINKRNYKILPRGGFSKKSLRRFISSNPLGLLFGTGFTVVIHNR